MIAKYLLYPYLLPFFLLLDKKQYIYIYVLGFKSFIGTS